MFGEMVATTRALFSCNRCSLIALPDRIQAGASPCASRIKSPTDKLFPASSESPEKERNQSFMYTIRPFLSPANAPLEFVSIESASSIVFLKDAKIPPSSNREKSVDDRNFDEWEEPFESWQPIRAPLTRPIRGCQPKDYLIFFQLI